MSTATVLSDVTQTLQVLLENQQPSPNEFFNVSLESPADDTIDLTPPKINLYLYRIIENPYAKNQDWLPIGTDTRQKPPLALNLFYVVTPFASTRLDEHRVLGEAMRIFYDHAIITAPRLQGSLKHTTEELKVDLCPFSLEELTRIWEAMQRPYRLSICYQVRIVLVDSAIEQPIRRVTITENRFVQRTRR